MQRTHYILLALWIISYYVLVLLTLPTHAQVYAVGGSAVDAQVVRDFGFLLLLVEAVLLYFGLRIARQRGSRVVGVGFVLLALLAQVTGLAILLVAANVASGIAGATEQPGQGSAMSRWLGLPPLSYSLPLLLGWLVPNLLLLVVSLYAFLRVPSTEYRVPSDEDAVEVEVEADPDSNPQSSTFTESRRHLLLYWLLLVPAVAYGVSGLGWLVANFGWAGLNWVDWLVYGGSVLFPLLWLYLLRAWHAFQPPRSYEVSADELRLLAGRRQVATMHWAAVKEAEDYQPATPAASRTLTLTDDTQMIEISDDYLPPAAYDRLTDEIASRTAHADWRADFLKQD